MRTSETIVKLAAALVEAQAQWPAIGKSADGYGYKYAPLDRVIAAVRPVLASNGLSFVQMPGVSEPDEIVLTSMLLHSSGEYIEDTMTIPVPKVGKANVAQCYGAGLTYARRYSLESMLGIASSEDIDGAVQDTKPSKTKAPPASPGPLGPLPDDELVIYEGKASDFWANVLVLIDRYTVPQHAQNAAKQLGYTGVHKNAMKRVEMYRALKQQAAERDAEETEKQDELTGAYAE
jgi:hypothetical protein